MRLNHLKAELKLLRKELEFIEGQLDNERMLETEDLAELSPKDIDKLKLQNEKLLTQVIELEVLLSG